MQIERCKICGGTINVLGSNHIRCNYCGQIYDLNGKKIAADQIYKEALDKQQQGTISGYEESRQLLESIPDYKDSVSKAIESYVNVENIKVATEEKRLEEERERQIQLDEDRKKVATLKKLKRVGIVVAGICTIIIIIAGIVSSNHKKKMDENYNAAVELFDNQQYIEAKEAFEGLDGYKNSEDYIGQIDELLEELQNKYDGAINLLSQDDFVGAIGEFLTIVDYKDSTQYINFCASMLLENARRLVDFGDYEGARNMIGYIPDMSEPYIEGQNLLIEIDESIVKNKYNAAIDLFNNQQYFEAQKLFKDLGDYGEAGTYLEQIGEQLYEEASSLFQNGEYLKGYELLAYIDENVEWSEYRNAVTLKQSMVDNYVGAINQTAVGILKNQGWESFEEYINSSIDAIYSSSNASQIKNEYSNYKPQKFDITNYYVSMHSEIDGTFEDAFGNTYSHAISISTPSAVNSGGYVEYVVNDSFNHLCGILVYSNSSMHTIGTKAHLEIIVDGEKVFSSIDIVDTSQPISFDAYLGEGFSTVEFRCEGEAFGAIVLSDIKTYYAD